MGKTKEKGNIFHRHIMIQNIVARWTESIPIVATALVIYEYFIETQSELKIVGKD